MLRGEAVTEYKGKKMKNLNEEKN